MNKNPHTLLANIQYNEYQRSLSLNTITDALRHWYEQERIDKIEYARALDFFQKLLEK